MERSRELGDAPENLIVSIINGARCGYWVALGLAVALRAVFL
jgi:hypothetical protein